VTNKGKGQAIPVQDIKSYNSVEVQVHILHLFLSSALGSGKCSISCPGRLNSRTRSLGVQLTRN